MFYSFGLSRIDVNPVLVETTWAGFIEDMKMLSEEVMTKETAHYICPSFFAGSRAVDHAVATHWVWMDVDHCVVEDLLQLIDTIDTIGIAAMIYTTASHKEVEPRFRIIIPMRVPIEAKFYTCVWKAVVDMLDIGHIVDHSKSGAGDIAFAPHRYSDQSWCEVFDGFAIDADQIIDEFYEEPVVRVVEPEPTIEGAFTMTPAYVRTAIERELVEFRTAPKGTGHHTMLACAGVMWGFKKAGMVVQSDWDHWVAEWEAVCIARSKGQRERDAAWRYAMNKAAVRELPKGAKKDLLHDKMKRFRRLKKNLKYRNSL